MTIFEKLISPMSRDTFFSEVYEKNPIVFDSIPLDQELFSVEDFDLLIRSASEVCPRRIRSNLQGQALVPPARATPSQVYDWIKGNYEHGATTILNYIDCLDLRCRKFSLGLCEALNARVSLTAFATPKGNQGFSPHFDTLDVFVVQISGEKSWSIADEAASLPTLRQGGLVEYTNGLPKPLIEVTLRKGQALYMPRGFVHWASASSCDSIHVTADIGSVTVGNLLRSRLAQAERESGDLPAPAVDLISKKSPLNLSNLFDKLENHLTSEASLEQLTLQSWDEKMMR
jgi:hypothetical protein